MDWQPPHSEKASKVRALALRVFFLNLVCTLICNTTFAGADVNVATQVNEESGLYSWASEGNGFSLELIQLLPDFVRAVYQSHHYPAKEVEIIANYCVFGTVIKNTSGQVLEYKVADWHYTDQDGKKHPVKTKTQWIEQWKKAGITFSWTLLPDHGLFDAGDWQQGFTTIKLPRMSTFDLTYTWKVGDTPYSETIEGLRCAPEQLVEQ